MPKQWCIRYNSGMKDPITTSEAASIIGIQPQLVRRYCNRGTCPRNVWAAIDGSNARTPKHSSRPRWDSRPARKEKREKRNKLPLRYWLLFRLRCN